MNAKNIADPECRLIENGLGNENSKHQLNYYSVVKQDLYEMDVLGDKNLNGSRLIEAPFEKKVYLGFTSTKKFWTGVFFLFLMVVPCSLIAPLTINLPAKDTYIKASWRMQGGILLTSPIISAMYLFNVKGLNFKRDFSFQVILKTSFANLFLFGWVVFYLLGCTYSVTSHADIITCSSGLVIFMISIVTGGTIHKYEVAAYALYFIGIFFLFTDPFALKAGTTEPSYLGDFLAINGAICAAAYSYTIKYTKGNLHPMIQTFYGFLTSIAYVFIFFPILTKSDRFFSFDPEYGAFGWLTDWTYFIEVIGITALVTGLLGNIGFFASYNYFPIEIVNGTLLLEPFVAQAAGIFLGQDEVPGIKTLIGCLLITAGYALASLGSKLKEQIQLRSNDSKVFEDISKEIELSIVE